MSGAQFWFAVGWFLSWAVAKTAATLGVFSGW